METGLAGRRAVITGGGSGIGLATARALAGEGCDVAIIGRRDRSEVVSELRAMGVRAHAIRADVSTESGLVRAIERAEELLGGIDLYVNNAAGTWHEPLVHITADAWERTLATNLGACVYGCREVSRRWIEGHRAGAIVIVGSTAIVSAQPRETSYRASKAALKAHMEVAAVELAPFGIRVNLVTPGGVDTEFVADAPAAQREMARRAIPMRREARPDEIPPAVLFLLSDQLSSYITGTNLIVDGGLQLRPIFGGSDEELAALSS